MTPSTWSGGIAFDLDERHEIMWGLGARHTRDDTEAGPNTRFDPRSRSLDTFNAFVQDTITLVPDKVFAMVGSKFEENDLTGFEFQPSSCMAGRCAPPVQERDRGRRSSSFCRSRSCTRLARRVA